MTGRATFTLDLPDEFPALGHIALCRLELQQLRDFRVAIPSKIILGVTSIALDQRGIGIIDAGARQIECHRIVLTRGTCEPDGRHYDLELGREMELVELIARCLVSCSLTS